MLSKFIFNMYPEGPDAPNARPADIINDIIQDALPKDAPLEVRRMARRYALQAGELGKATEGNPQLARVMAVRVGRSVADEINDQYLANETYPDSVEMQRIFSAAYGVPVRNVAIGPEGWTDRIDRERAGRSHSSHPKR